MQFWLKKNRKFKKKFFQDTVLLSLSKTHAWYCLVFFVFVFFAFVFVFVSLTLLQWMSLLYCKKSTKHQTENMRSPLIIVEPYTDPATRLLFRLMQYTPHPPPSLCTIYALNSIIMQIQQSSFFQHLWPNLFFRQLIDKRFEHVRNVTHRLTSKLFWAQVSQHSKGTLTIANIMDERIEFMT